MTTPLTPAEIAELREHLTLLLVAEDHARLYGYCNDAEQIEQALRAEVATLKARIEKLRGISRSFAEHVMSYANDERSLDTDWQALRRTCRATMEALAALDKEPKP